MKSICRLSIFPIILLISASCTKSERTVDEETQKPNIVFILVDDLGWSDLGCYGSSFYETPSIDRLATEGVMFTNAYAACHVCSPTRASILTGQYPARLRLTDWLPGRPDYPHHKFINAETVQHIPYENTALAQVLKANGYATAIYGKWHLGEDSASARRQGFDIQIPKWNKGWPKEGYFSPYGMIGLEGGPEGEYLTDRLTDEAIKFIEANKEGPFFLYLSHFTVHDPIEGRPDLVKKYEQKLTTTTTPSVEPYILEGNPDMPNPPSRKDLDTYLKDKSYDGFKLLPNQTVKIKQHQDNVEFAGMVESLDESVGRVIDKLGELGLESNTMVIFFSDNGGMSAGNFYYPDRLIKEEDVDKGFSTSNLPLRAGKGWLYEGGIRVPLIIKKPGITTAGTVSEVPVISTDFYSTILELVGLRSLQKGNDGIDGTSLLPLLQNRDISTIENRALYWHFPHYSNHGQQSPGGAVRYGDYKLLEYFENGTVQLFNLKNDPGELNDLSRSEPDKAKELLEMLQQWRRNVNADMLRPNPDYVNVKQ